jgi:hypothetical protein
VTAAERLGAALMTAGLSYRITELFELDRSEDAAYVPAQRPSTP